MPSFIWCGWGGETWSAVGSLNGGEASHKLNRAVVLLVDLPAVYNRLLEVFLHDWALTIRERRSTVCATEVIRISPLGFTASAYLEQA
jgi:hypothetical protein